MRAVQTCMVLELAGSRANCQCTCCTITFACQPALHSLIHRLVQADLQAWLQRIIIMHLPERQVSPTCFNGWCSLPCKYETKWIDSGSMTWHLYRQSQCCCSQTSSHLATCQQSRQTHLVDRLL